MYRRLRYVEVFIIMLRIAITGANSFLGKEIIRELINGGHQVVPIVQDKRTILGQELYNNCEPIIELSMDSYDKIGRITGGADIFINLAWDGTRGEKRKDELVQKKNYEQGLIAVESMLEYGTKKIILAGSQAEYGDKEGEVFENDLCKPLTAYGKWKHRLFESTTEVCKKKNAKCVETRIFSLYGPGDYAGSLIMSLLSKMPKNENCQLTSCMQTWDYLYVNDAADAFLKLCNARNTEGVYNLCSSDVRPLREYVEELKFIMESDSRIEYGKVTYSNEKVISMFLNNDKIISELGWKPKYTFNDGINDTLKILLLR